MEARGKFDFNATAEDELSFRKGEILKILGSQEDWFKAELNGQEGFIPKNYVDRPVPSWFQDTASRSTAEEILMSQEVGGFLIRGSQSSPGEFSISVRHDSDVQHFKVMKTGKGHYYLWSEKFTSLNKLVEYYKTCSISKQREIFLRDREEPRGPAPHSVKRVNDHSNRHQPPAPAHHRPTEQAYPQPNNMGPAGRNSPVGTLSSYKRPSDIIPARGGRTGEGSV